MGMKPFNLEAAKRGEPVVQRSGRPARILATDCRCGDDHHPRPIAVELKTATGFWMLENLLASGRVYSTSDCEYDLFMAPRGQKRWIVSWVDAYGDFCACGFGTKAHAELRAVELGSAGRSNIAITEVGVEA